MVRAYHSVNAEKETNTMLCGSVVSHGDTLFNKRGVGSGNFSL